MSERDNTLLDQFIPTENQIGELKLRPITARTLTMLYLTKNPLMNKPEEHQLLYAISAFIYLHAEELEKVYAVVRDEALFFAAVNEFSDHFKPSELIKAVPMVQGMIQKAFMGQDFTVETNAPDPN